MPVNGFQRNVNPLLHSVGFLDEFMQETSAFFSRTMMIDVQISRQAAPPIQPRGKGFRAINLMTKVLLLVFGQFSLFSCARQMSSDVYTSRQAGEVSTTYTGTIKDRREVSVEQGDGLEDNALGMAGGGVAGGIAGSAIGRGKFMPTAAGAVLGAVSGSFVEKKLKQQSAWEYIVQLDNGSLVTVVQSKKETLRLEEPVYLIVSQTGRSRLVSRDTRSISNLEGG